jgi:hypothetical protein
MANIIKSTKNKFVKRQLRLAQKNLSKKAFSCPLIGEFGANLNIRDPFISLMPVGEFIQKIGFYDASSSLCANITIGFEQTAIQG